MTVKDLAKLKVGDLVRVVTPFQTSKLKDQDIVKVTSIRFAGVFVTAGNGEEFMLAQEIQPL
jgi:hypothetical protein